MPVKKYIGKQEIEAEPMKYGKAYVNGLIPQNAYIEEYDDWDGYHIVHSNGFKEWLPEKSFHDEYQIADSFSDRLMIERRELTEKLEKLLRLTESPKFADVIKDEHQRRLLIMQRDYMGEYLNILNQRILLYSYEVQEETSSN